MGVLDDFTGEGDVFVVSEVRAVYHDRREAAFDTVFAEFERVSVVEMENDRHRRAEFLGVFHRAARQMTEECLVGVVPRAFRDLQDHRRFRFGAGHDDRLELFEVVEIIGGDCIATRYSFYKKLPAVDEAEFCIADRFLLHEERSLFYFGVGLRENEARQVRKCTEI